MPWPIANGAGGAARAARLWLAALLLAAAPGLNALAQAPDTAAPVLDDRWRADANGNGIPDFIETELGLDPSRDACPIRECGDTLPGGEAARLPRNTLLVLDASGSMNAKIGGAPKIEIAKAALARYASFAAIRDRLGFLVYGHKGSNKEAGKAESCTGIELLSAIGGVNPETFPSTLAAFRATGWTPIAAALEAAASAFKTHPGEVNRVILVSDGIETCGGDPAAVAQRLRAQELAVTVDVIGFDVRDPKEAAALRRIAEAGGGTYTEARNARDLDTFFKAQGEALRRNTEAFVCEAQNATSTKLCDLQVTFRATQRIAALQREVPYRSPAYDAQQAVIDRIQRLRDGRDERRAQAAARVEELRRQASELRAAMLRAYGVR